MNKETPKHISLHVSFHRPGEKAVVAHCNKHHRQCLAAKTLLTPFELALWKRIDGTSSVAQICDELTRDRWSPAATPNVPEILDKWAQTGLITWVEQKKQVTQPSPRQLKAMSIARHMFAAYQSAQKLPAEIQSTKEYHSKHTENPAKHFEEVETTASHMLRYPHPALGGKSYGNRLWEKLAVHFEQKEALRVAEVGGGTGFLAREFLNQLRKDRPDLWHKLLYVFVDLSTGFIASQRSKTYRHRAKTEFVRASGQCLPFTPAKLDLLICNEVIADFDVVHLRRSDIESGVSSALPARQQALDQIKRFGLTLDDAPPEFVFPRGSVNFLAEGWRILAPGGVAFIVEYGHKNLYPKEELFKGHKEYSVHFGLLNKVAEALGFEVELVNLLDYLYLAPDVPTLTLCSKCLLIKLFGNRIKKVATRTITRQMLAEILEHEIEFLENLQFETARKDFWVLLLKKPYPKTDRDEHI